MGDIVYKAVYSDAHLSHFKYIDKWKSKSGKWVYKYKKDVTDELDELKNKLEAHRKELIRKKKKDGSSSGAGEWHSTGSDVGLSDKRRNEESIKGNDKTRVRKVNGHYRREYQDSATQRNMSNRIAQYNEYLKGNNRLKRFVMDFNDKYGPKYVSEVTYTDGAGQNYVLKYTTNVIGNRDIGIETYTYYDETRIKRSKKRKGKHRNAVKPMTHQQYIAHHGIKGQKWGVRRYQNPDGTLTPEGRRYYGLERQGLSKRIKEHTNVGDTGRRSAAASAKSSLKKQSKWGTAGVVATMAAGAYLGAPVAAAAIAAGVGYVAELGTATAVGALWGRHQGRSLAKQQNKDAIKQVISGQQFVVSQLTATSSVGIIGPYYDIDTSLSSRR